MKSFTRLEDLGINKKPGKDYRSLRKALICQTLITARILVPGLKLSGGAAILTLLLFFFQRLPESGSCSPFPTKEIILSLEFVVLTTRFVRLFNL